MLNSIKQTFKKALKETQAFYKKTAPQAVQTGVNTSVTFLSGLLSQVIAFGAQALSTAKDLFQKVKNRGSDVFSSRRGETENEQSNMLGSIPSTVYNTAASVVSGAKSNVTYLWNYARGNQSKSDNTASRASAETQNEEKLERRQKAKN